MMLSLFLLAAGSVGEPECVRILRPIAAGVSPVSSDFEPAPACPSAASAGFRYDTASGAAVARRDLAAGELLRPLAASLQVTARKGQDLQLRERVGGVTVARGVTAAQSGRSGQRIFVRTAEGAVFSAVIVQ